ncbi:T6SS effector BTH_I2691 family protein [Variovorax paradoxus]|jgi:hypothetical protein|uniref:T6SS effector BTH_I2691 family protein n=1 Tax=Variovorax paradoxus TaxID=34073 RepID=UPI0029C93D11|nr:T6SS effector BTH_I2691 family protein [Variovorax paradoxus]WPH19288.1 T6SS effector BTH_I2691 family protein [Variovorax paradoxus]
MPCATPCKNCDRKGLPILFVRYAAAYSAQAKGMNALKPLQPMGQLQARPGGVAMQTALYNVRMLRAGYLYLRIERKGVGPEWQGYIVHPHGYLGEFPVGLPQAAASHPACEMEFRGANSSMVWVGDAKNVTKLDYMFHPDPIDYEHLKKEIEPSLGKYMQGFDVAGWAGGSTSQKDTLQPGQLNGQVVEFSALSSEAVRDACEPLMYGLMGSNAQERGWGDYEEQVEVRTPAVTAMGDFTGTEDVSYDTRKRIGPTYDKAHGKRLRKMAEFLQTHKGAVVACEDAVGIAQELGHLQSEAHTPYSHWQIEQASGFAKGVTNEWVLQTAVSAKGLRSLVKKGAFRAISAGYEESKNFHAPLPSDPQARAAELAARNANRERNRAQQEATATQKMDANFARLFDEATATNFSDTVHKTVRDKAETLRSKLGEDQGRWLVSPSLFKVMERYSNKDTRVDRPGGGANLSLQLAQCLAGTESNDWGRKWLEQLDLWGDNALSRTLCFNNLAYLASLRQASEGEGQTGQPAALPGPDPSAPLLESLAVKLKLLAGRVGLGDKALAFMDAFPAIGESGRLRKLAWPAHVMTLMSVKMVAGLAALPVTRKEAQLVRYMALTGITTLGRTVENEAERLQLRADDVRRAQMLGRAEKLAKLSTAQKGKAGEAAMARARGAAPGSRAAMLGGVFDFGASLLKGGQLIVNPDGRTAAEVAGNVLQSIGSIADWRAKAYEETIFKGIRGVNVYKEKVLEIGLDSLNLTQLRNLQKMAFKFLLPAAMVSVWFDGMDANLSLDRRQYGLAAAQFASVAGTIFTIGATTVVAFDISILGVSAASLGAVLGLIGAVLIVATIIAIGALKEDEWINWLSDCPLNKKKTPIHANLHETLQKLANVQADLKASH